MSDEERDPFADVPELAIINELEGRKQTLETSMGESSFALPGLALKYEEAIGHLDEEATNIARGENLQAVMAGIGATALLGIRQIELLRGITPDKELDALVDELTPQLEKTRAFFDRYGTEGEDAEEFMKAVGSVGVSTEAEVPSETLEQEDESPEIEAAGSQVPTPGKSETPAAAGSIGERTASSEIEPKEKLKINIAENDIWIGDRCLSDKIQPRTKERLISNLRIINELKPGQVITASELRERASPEIPPNSDQYKPIFAWLEEFARSPDTNQEVLVHNGKRGTGSRYERNPEIDFELLESGKSSQAEEVTDEAEQEQAETTGERNKTPVNIEIGEKSVNIGKRGRTVPYTGKLRPGQKDYGTERKKALIYLIENPGRKIKPQKLWSAIYDDDRPFDDYVLGQVRGWLVDKITYRKQNLVQSTGLGPNARYAISPDYDVSWSVEGMEPAPRTNPARSRNEGKQSETRNDEPLGDKDMYLVARHLMQFNIMFEEQNKCALSANSIRDLRSLLPEESDIGNDSKADQSALKQATERFQKLLKDEKKFEDLLNTMSDNDGSSQFAEFLLEFADDEGRQLIVGLMESRLEHAGIKMNPGGAFSTVENYRIIDKDENQTWHGSKVTEDLSGEARKRNGGIESSQHHDLLVTTVQQVAAEFIENLDPNIPHRDSVYYRNVQGFTVRDAKKAANSGIISHEKFSGDNPAQHTLEEVIKIMLFKNPKLSNMVKMRRNAQSLNELINSEVDKAKEVWAEKHR